MNAVIRGSESVDENRTATGQGAYTVPDIAVLTKSSDRHIWRLIDMGTIPGVFRLGRLVRVSKAVFDAWLAAGCPSNRKGGR